MLETFKAILDKFDQTSKAMALPDQLSKIGLMPRLTWVLGKPKFPSMESESFAFSQLGIRVEEEQPK